MKVKHVVMLLMLGLAVAFLFAGCAKPEAEIAAAETAIQGAIRDGANIYAKDELQKAQRDRQAAMDEITAQSKKLFKSYGKAKQMLVTVTQQANDIKTLIPPRKEKAKNDAINALAEVRTAVDSTKALLDQAPKGKGTKADIEAMTADLVGLEDMVVKAQTRIDSEDYFGAIDQARIIKQRVASIKDQICQAFEKAKRPKPAFCQ